MTPERFNRTVETQVRNEKDRLERLAAELGHDLNNLLQGIRIHVELALEARSNYRSLEEVLDELEALPPILEAGEALAAQLLSLGQGSTHTPPIMQDIHMTLATPLQLIQRLMPRSITVRADLAATESWGFVSSADMSQLLLNLALNARNAMPEGGTLNIVTTNRPPTDDRDGGPYLCLSVVDTGEGMDEAVRARAFDARFTTRPGGSGLGLSIVERVARAAHGVVELRSVPGEGTRVDVFFPVRTGRPG